MERIGTAAAVKAYAQAEQWQRLSFYQKVPAGEVTLWQLEQAALDRLAVLHALDAAHVRGLEQNDQRPQTLANRLLPLMTEDDAWRDAASHFALRLAFAQTEDNRRWFVTQERALLRMRLMALAPEDLASFMKASGLGYARVAPEELAGGLREDILAAEQSRAPGTRASLAAAYLRVPFEEALDLVRDRAVVLHGGDAIVGQDRLVSVLLGRFRSSLSEAMLAASRATPLAAPRLERLRPLLTIAAKRLVPANAARAFSGASCTAADIESLAEKSFPPCMRELHRAFTRDSHLRHWGRMQYGLFLKGVGLPLEEAIAFWSAKLSKKFEDTKLRPYLYNVRHLYGKEGRGVDYTPYGCAKVISFPVAQGEHHGCPFNTHQYSLEQLREFLAADGLPQEGAAEMLDYAANGHPQIACCKYYELRHPGAAPDELVVNHPNNYAAHSVKYWGARLSAQQGQQPGATPAPAAPAASAPAAAPAPGPMDVDDSFDAAMAELDA